MKARSRTCARGVMALDVLALEKTDSDEVVALLRSVFGTSVTLDSYRWKHHDNPAGPSTGWVARDRSGIVGVRPFMRWRLAVGDVTVPAARPVDTATAPRAQGRGVFRALTEHALRELSSGAEDGPQIVFNTPNENSRPAYAKSGWAILPRVRHVIAPLFGLRRARLEEDAGALGAIARGSNELAGIRSERTLTWLEWRYDSRSGNAYRAVRLRSAAGPNGLVYRVVTRRGLRILALCELVGGTEDRMRLVRAACTSERAVGVLTVSGPGAHPLVQHRGVPRGSSVVAVNRLVDVAYDPLSIHSWSLTLGDLERVL